MANKTTAQQLADKLAEIEKSGSDFDAEMTAEVLGLFVPVTRGEGFSQGELDTNALLKSKPRLTMFHARTQPIGDRRAAERSCQGLSAGKGVPAQVARLICTLIDEGNHINIVVETPEPVAAPAKTLFIWQLEATSSSDRTHKLEKPLAEWAKVWNVDVINKYVQPNVDTSKPYNKLVAVVADSVEEAISLALKDDREWRWFNSNEQFGDCLRHNEPKRVEVPGSERSRVVVLSGSDSLFSKKPSGGGNSFGGGSGGGYRPRW
jgi:hypothetical protein